MKSIHSKWQLGGSQYLLRDSRPATVSKPSKHHYKSMSYAYPSSPRAVQYGYGETGCYCIILEGDNGFHTIGAFPTSQQARHVANERPEPYSNYSL